MDIAIFEGDYMEWTSFHDLFDSLVHQNSKLSDVQKLQYLKSKVRGEAAQIIKHLQITHSNYETAWNLLKSRFQNTKHLVDTYVSRLFNQAPVKQEKSSELRKLLDNMTESLFALKNMGQQIESWDCIIIHMITQRLPTVSFKL